jgi:hypothetical protein
LRDHYLIIRRLAWKKNFEEQKRFQPKSKYKKKKKKKVIPDTRASTVKDPIVPLKSARNIQSLTSGMFPSTMSYNDAAFEQLSIRDSIYSAKSEHNIVPPRIQFPYRPLQRYTSNIQNYMAEKYLDTLYKDKLFLKNLPKEPGVACPNEAGTGEDSFVGENWLQDCQVQTRAVAGEETLLFHQVPRSYFFGGSEGAPRATTEQVASDGEERRRFDRGEDA